MKAITKLAIGAAVVLLVAAGVQPAQAACPAPGYLIEVAGAYLVANPNWCGQGGGGCLDSQGGPPISSHFDGFFWAETGANEGFLAGNDNGTWGAREWVKQGTVFLDSYGEFYHYAAHISVNDHDLYYQGGTAINWASTNLIDGCVDLVTPATRFDECTCMLLTDEWGGDGYYAILSRLSNSQGNFIFNENPLTQYDMVPIPRPEVVSSTRNATAGTVTFNINVPSPTGGDYRDPACGCNFGFRVYAAAVAEGGMAPSNRSACTQRALIAAGGPSLSYNAPGFADACRAAGFAWVPATNAVGAAQPVTPFDGARATASVTVDCGDPLMGYDVYLATAIGVNEGAGVQLGSVGQNSFQVKCGNYQLAEPNRPERSLPGRSGDAPRRDNRGNRDR